MNVLAETLTSPICHQTLKSKSGKRKCILIFVDISFHQQCHHYIVPFVIIGKIKNSGVMSEVETSSSRLRRGAKVEI